MGNTFITPLAVAKVAIITLLNNLCFAGLVYRDYSKEFRKIGTTVRIRKPATFEAVEFVTSVTNSGGYQAVTEEHVDVLMDKLLIVPATVTAQELTLDIVSFNTQVVEPAMQALAQKVDEELAKLYKDIPYYSETTDVTVVADVLAARKVQNDLKVPFGQTRQAVMCPMTAAALLGLPAFHEVDKVGETKPLRDASLGHKFGYDFYENQNIQHHIRGTLDGLGSVTAEEPAGETSIGLGELGTGTIKKGTIITFTEKAGQYVVTADATITTNAATVIIYPGLAEVVAATTVATLHGPVDADEPATSRENLMFHKNAFGFVSAPLADPIGGAKGAHATYKGLTINTVYGYDMETFNNQIIFSILCGFKTLTPELALRLYDAS
ncbi:hypothetical protein ES704_01794 [subsurface metagenome]|jgi:hypothetical protein